LDKFARSLPHREVPITETWVRPLWDLPGIQPAIFLFALACFIAEWALRRWKGIREEISSCSNLVGWASYETLCAAELRRHSPLRSQMRQAVVVIVGGPGPGMRRSA
jgi:hypothetical protein